MTTPDHWPKGEQYRQPEPVAKPLPKCRRCGQEHDAPTPWCKRDPKEEQERG